jgi:hypothetical protein
VGLGKDISNPDIRFSAGGEWIVFRDNDRHLLIDAETGEVIRSGEWNTPGYLGVSPDGDYLYDRNCGFLEIGSGNEIGVEGVEALCTLSIAFRGDGRYAFASIKSGADDIAGESEGAAGLFSVQMPAKPVCEWRYKGINEDEDHLVSCKDCEKGSRCRRCVHNPKLPDQYADEATDCFHPAVSCSFCSDYDCGYRWTYPC